MGGAKASLFKRNLPLNTPGVVYHRKVRGECKSLKDPIRIPSEELTVYMPEFMTELYDLSPRSELEIKGEILFLPPFHRPKKGVVISLAQKLRVEGREEGRIEAKLKAGPKYSGARSAGALGSIYFLISIRRC